MSNAFRVYRDPLDPTCVVKTDSEWIDNDTYTEMVQKIIIPCTDVVLTIADDTAIYLAKRVVLPMAGPWMLGGRMFFNDESPEDSIARCVQLEAGVCIDPSRFEMLGSHLYSFMRIAQGDFGGKSLAVTFKLEVTLEELRLMSIGLSPKEYDTTFGIQRYTRERLVSEQVHPALLDLFDEIFVQT